jgi:chromosomal replication initiation ATPase DnaA
MHLTEEMISRALLGQFTHYVGKPVEDISIEEEDQREREARRALRAQQAKDRKERHAHFIKQEAELLIATKADNPVTPILAAVSTVHNVRIEQIMGRERERRVALARSHLMWELKQRLGYGSPRIAAIVERDYSTILSNTSWFNKNRHSFADKIEAVARMLTTTEIEK